MARNAKEPVCTQNWLHDENQASVILISVGRRGSTKDFKVLLVFNVFVLKTPE